MTDRPILFSAAMIRALLTGRKTQTRRALDVPPVTFDAVFCDDGIWYIGDATTGQREARLPVRYQPGDRLWVREAHAILPRTAYRMSIGTGTIAQREHPTDGYSAAVFREGFDRSGNPGWRPSIHLPRWASRLTLTVTDVRVQRLQDISEEDAQAEGCIKLKVTGRAAEFTGSQYLGLHWPSCRAWYRDLWDSLNVARGFGWDANPWVVAVTFAVAHRNIDSAEA